MDDDSDFEVYDDPDEIDPPADLVNWLLSTTRVDEDGARYELQLDLMQAYQKEWARSEARRLEHQTRLAAQVTTLQDITTARDKIERGVEPPDYLVPGLHACGDTTMLVAQNKVGKTTLALNLIRSLLDGEPFLGEWETEFTGNVLYLNYEVSEARFIQWVQRLGLQHTGRLVDAHLRGKVFPLDHPKVQEQIAKIARNHDVSLLVVDPFQRAFAGVSENDTTEVNRFLSKVDELKDQAGIPDALILDHAGHAERGRARGSSAKGGGVDSTWVLTEDDGIRRFSARGRDIDVPPTPLHYDYSTLALRLTGDRARRDAPSLSLADHGLLAVMRAIEAKGKARGASEVRKHFRQIGGAKHMRALREAEGLGYILRHKEGSAHVFEVTEAGEERADGLGEGATDDA